MSWAQQDYEKRKIEAERYLDGLAQQLGSEHISVERMVSEGTAATEIPRIARALSADLIVMTAHGFSASLTPAPRGSLGASGTPYCETRRGQSSSCGEHRIIQRAADNRTHLQGRMGT